MGEGNEDNSGKHGSYLQGMETGLPRRFLGISPECTDPTYKEWKQLKH